MIDSLSSLITVLQACYSICKNEKIRNHIRKAAVHFRRYRNPTVNAISGRESKRHGIIKVNTELIDEHYQSRFEILVGRYGIITKDSEGHLQCDWAKLFHQLKHEWTEIARRIGSNSYRGTNIACVALLPLPFKKKSKIVDFFARELIDMISERDINIEYMERAILEGKMDPCQVSKVCSPEEILILQPVATDRSDLSKAFQVIDKFSDGIINEIVTLVEVKTSGSHKPRDRPSEKVLVELDLSPIPSLEGGKNG